METSLPSTSDQNFMHDARKPGGGSGNVKRARSVRSERRRDRFIKVLEGKERNGYGGRYGGPAGAATVGTTKAGGVDAGESERCEKKSNADGILIVLGGRQF
jgi:hypothetical protein